MQYFRALKITPKLERFMVNILVDLNRKLLHNRQTVAIYIYREVLCIRSVVVRFSSSEPCKLSTAHSFIFLLSFGSKGKFLELTSYF